jgi:hypothetical protein
MPGACPPPRYQVERILENNASEVSLHVSIRLEDFAPMRLVCLAETLRQRYPSRNLWAAIFSSSKAAQGFSPGGEKTPLAMFNESKLHAIYTYNKEERDDHLLLLPDGNNQRVDSLLQTRMDLPLAGVPVCKLAISGRCLLEFQHLVYPSAQYPSTVPPNGIAGEVSLTGRIERSGVLTNIRLAEARVDSPETQAILVDWAIRNFHTWRFEPAERQSDVRLTYKFELTDAPLDPNQSVQFRLPDEVRIRMERRR